MSANMQLNQLVILDVIKKANMKEYDILVMSALILQHKLVISKLIKKLNIKTS